MIMEDSNVEVSHTLKKYKNVSFEFAKENLILNAWRLLRRLAKLTTEFDIVTDS